MRQIYKTHLKNQTMGAEKDILRIFNGVANDAQQKGELFGLHNLLKYKDGSFMEDIWASHQSDVVDESMGDGIQVLSESGLAGAVASAAQKDLSEGNISLGVGGKGDRAPSLLDNLGFDREATNNAIATGVNFSHSDLMKNNAKKPREEDEIVEETEESGRDSEVIIVPETQVVEVEVEGEDAAQHSNTQNNTPSRNTAKEILLKAQPRRPAAKGASKETKEGGDGTQSGTETQEMSQPPKKAGSEKKAQSSPKARNVQVMGWLATEVTQAAAIPDDLLYIPNYDRQKKKKKKNDKE